MTFSGAQGCGQPIRPIAHARVAGDQIVPDLQQHRRQAARIAVDGNGVVVGINPVRLIGGNHQRLSLIHI